MSDAASPLREFAIDVVTKLRAAGHQALFAGGCVRDQLLGRQPKDYDVATSALPEHVRDLFGRRRTLAIGASFGVITVLGGKDRGAIEVATFRTDGVYRDGRRPESVSYTDARHDAQRRDFTINGLFFDPLLGEIIDYVDGAADLQAGLIRAIGEPRHRFAEDKLRMLRAIRFAATFRFTLDEATLAAIQEMSPEVAAVSGERIGAELRRILVHANRRRGVELAAESNLLATIAPEIWPHAAARDGTWRAALERLERLGQATTVAAALAALLVDGDATHGATVRGLAARWRLTNKEVDRTIWLVSQLPAIRAAASLPWPQLQPILANDGAEELMALLAADRSAGDAGLARCREKLALPVEIWNPPELITGDDLIAAGLPPSRAFSELLDHIRTQQLEGQVQTRADALAEAVRWHNAR